LVKYWSTVMIVGLFGNWLVEVVCAMGEFKFGRGWLLGFALEFHEDALVFDGLLVKRLESVWVISYA
jgi:hypothetical protein